MAAQETETMQERESVGKRLWRSASVPVLSIILALVIGGVILALSGNNPIAAYVALLRGSFGSAEAFGRTLEKATPLIFGGLAVAFAFKAGLFNIGGQGQLLIGAIIAAYVGFAFDGLPFIIHMPLALIAGAVAGGLYGAIAGALKAYTGAHEVITTIMLNYVAINLTDYLADGPWKDEGIIARTPAVLESAVIPTWGFLPFGFLLAVLAAIATWYLVYRTTFGYAIRTTGINPNAAQYAGIKVSQVIILTMGISGFLAGMGGAVETLGVVGRYQPGFNLGLGFDGITIALLAKTNPLGVIPAAILIGAMQAGSSQMQFSAGVPFQIIDVIQALILFFVSADIIVRKVFRMRETGGEKITLSTGWGS
ncbi:MAG: ABC transporter permease [Anaerolineae bacterium]|nr:ABC transporter permease [Anaerolineae bacterium]MCO5187900.1 ABC transporter permease [Anaerolineae bacterium]MCO5192658.1 ABC transporter permease [Anaerolineae bacterium]MCO5197830.1 ABC transporter permease [Anaerolineae bacterium]MCO5205326.1 ABC transporter permease [Anaerolineae bacterium]